MNDLVHIFVIGAGVLVLILIAWFASRRAKTHDRQELPRWQQPLGAPVEDEEEPVIALSGSAFDGAIVDLLDDDQVPDNRPRSAHEQVQTDENLYRPSSIGDGGLDLEKPDPATKRLLEQVRQRREMHGNDDETVDEEHSVRAPRNAQSASHGGSILTDDFTVTDGDSSDIDPPSDRDVRRN